MLISTLLIKTALLLLFCYTIIDVVHFLALITRTSAFRKKFRTYYHQLRLYGKKDENEEELGCWQDPPEDVKEMIAKHMSFSGRVRLSSLCKSWRIASMRREIPTRPQLPWLVHPQPKTGDTLSFSSLTEGKVFKSRLPFPDTKSWRKTLHGRTNQTSYLLASSKGWLVMLEREELHNSIMIKRVEVIYLINPISGAQHSLPPLQTIPGHTTVDSIPGQVILSSPDISTCIVAATLGERKLIFCRPRDKSWSVFQVLDESDTEGHIAYILFSSTGVLYGLVRGSDNCGGQAAWIEDRKLKFEGDEELELKVIYDKLDREWLIDEGFSEHEFERVRHRSYLAESTNNELLLIYQFVGTDLGEEVMEGNVVAEEGNNNNNNNGEEDEINNMEGDVQYESVLGWIERILIISRAMYLKSFFNTDKPADILDLKTRCFRVYKIDPENSNFRRVKDLGDQILFLAEDYSSLSLSLLTSDFKELPGNCIYFATRGLSRGTVHTSREIGIFYLDSGRIERSFPSFEMTEDSRLSWLMPSIW